MSAGLPPTAILCAICCASEAEEPDLTRWIDVFLDGPITWRLSLAPAAGQTSPAGPGRLCPLCAAWWPNARTAPLPGPVAEFIDAMAAKVANRSDRRRFKVEMIGAYRILGRSLRAA